MTIDWNIASTWDDMYSVKRKIGHNRGEKIGYGREAMKQAYKADSDALDMHKERVQSIVKTLGLRAGTSILVLGCGLPFLVETLRDIGYAAWGVDNSSFVQANLNEVSKSARDNFIKADLLKGNVIPLLRSRIQLQTVDTIISEDLINWLAPVSLPIFAANCESLAGENPILHLTPCAKIGEDSEREIDVDAGIDRPYIPPYYRRNNITWWSLSQWAMQFSNQHHIVDTISKESLVGTA